MLARSILIWFVLLTLAIANGAVREGLFEFLGGHFLFGRPWALLLADYNLLAGRIWVMVLIVSLITPVVAYTRRGSRPAAPSTFLQR